MSRLTAQQQAAVEAAGNVLVMAGAGTGKTHTLVARVLHFALHPVAPVALDRCLIVTFTEAAAAELQRRLRTELTARHQAAPQDRWLADQVIRLDRAPIGTLHSYCLGLVRAHFLELGLDPTVRTLDEATVDELAEAAAETVWAPYHARTDPEALAVREWWTRACRGDLRAASRFLQRQHQAVQALEDPAEWSVAQLKYWSATEPTSWTEALLGSLHAWAEEWLGRLAGFADPIGARLNPPASGRLPRLRKLAAGRLSRSEAAADLVDLSERPGETWPKGRKTECREPLKRLFDEAAALAGWLHWPEGAPDPLVEDWALGREQAATVLRLGAEFSAEFTRLKRVRRGLDFADQEQFALELLGRGPAAGTTPVAGAERQRFDLVLVDEGQDLNAAQDAILRAVSRSAADSAGGNRFLVGDVKQAIYRFRRADPAIFQRYARAWSGTSGDGRMLTLNENFRSAARVLDFVNGLFPWLMRAELGGVTFDDSAALQFGAATERVRLNGPGPRVEIHWCRRAKPNGARAGGDAAPEVEPGESEDPETATSLELEAGRIVVRLRELHDSGLMVWDKERQETRPVRWGDMAVLLRAKAGRAATFATVFAAAGVPLQGGDEGFFERREIRDLLLLLRLLDNPLQDAPLLGGLRSPFGGLTDVNELSVIRLVRPPRRDSAGAPEGWWTLLNHFVETGRAAMGAPGIPTAADGIPEVGAPPAGADVFTHPLTGSLARAGWVKVERFLRRLAEWRRLATRGPISRALEAALDETEFEAIVRAGPEGGVAHAHVQQFLVLVRRYDQQHPGGAAGLLAWLARQEQAGLVAVPGSGGAEAVSLLTIHKSKGLEFPVVVVAALGTRFKRSSSDEDAGQLDVDQRWTPRLYPAVGPSYPTPALWLAQRQRARDELGEELRLLYVAMTRAADRLLLYGTISGAQFARWNELGATTTPPLSVPELELATAPADWIGRALGRWPGVAWPDPGEDPTATDLSPEERCPTGETDLFQWRVWPAGDPAAVDSNSAVTEIGLATEGPPPGPPRSDYPHEAATTEPAKATVTGLRKRQQREAAEESGRLTIRRSGQFVELPESTEPGNVDAVTRGLLHHRFLEYVEPDRTESEAALAGEVQRLVTVGRFTPSEAEVLDRTALLRFWSGPLGSHIRAHVAELRRELPFTLRLTVPDLRALGFVPDPGLAADEFLVVQGVIDLVCLGPEEAWLLDFKTDRLPTGPAGEAALAKKAADYAPQLALYALAVERLFGRRVTAGWLHFLATGAEVRALSGSPVPGSATPGTAAGRHSS